MPGPVSLNSIFEDAQPDLLAYKVDADNETINGTGVDMTGYQGVVFLAVVGKGEAANIDLKVQQDTVSNFAAAADLADTKVTFAIAAGTNGFAFVEVKNPLEQYLRPVLVVPDLTTARPAAVISIRYGKSAKPETNADGEKHQNPAEGTA